MKKTGIKRVILILSFVFALSVVNTAQAQSIRNSSGGYMGKVENDGTVRNSSGGYMGKAEYLSRKQAAAVFFFFHF